MVPPRDQIELAANQLPPVGGGAVALDWNSGAEGPIANDGIDTPADNFTQQDWRQNYYAAAAFSDDVRPNDAYIYRGVMCFLDTYLFESESFLSIFPTM